MAGRVGIGTGVHRSLYNELNGKISQSKSFYPGINDYWPWGHLSEVTRDVHGPGLHSMDHNVVMELELEVFNAG